jgi:hypothetical protein
MVKESNIQSKIPSTVTHTRNNIHRCFEEKYSFHFQNRSSLLARCLLRISSTMNMETVRSFETSPIYTVSCPRYNIVTHRFIARQRFGKQARNMRARNNRRQSIARQQSGKHAGYRWKLCFLWGPPQELYGQKSRVCSPR